MALYLIMMGVQGAGKGVQATTLSQKYNIPQVSTGDMFRAMKHRDDELAHEVQSILSSGQLVSDDLTCRIVADRLALPDAQHGVILDGFPRSEPQAAWLEQHLASKGERVAAVLLLELDLYTAFKRAFGRITSAAGENLNIFYNADKIKEWRFEDHPEKAYPPRLTGTTQDGKPFVQRGDDANAFAVIKRMDTYLETTMPLTEWYAQHGLLVKIDAARSIETVTADIVAAVEARR